MDEEDCDESQRRKRKREKHKEREGKGKRQRKASSKVQEEQAAVVSSTYQSSKPLSLKIKLGQGSSKRNRSVREDSPMYGLEEEEEESLVIDQEQWQQGDSEDEEVPLVIDDEMEVSQPADQLSDENNDSDEGEWLKALEDGDVDERGYLPKKKGQGNLTARQKAMQGDNDATTEELVELPVARKTKEITEEMLLKRSERNKRRKILADKRKEKNKVETVQRLLQKQSTKKKDKKLNMETDSNTPMMTYRNGPDMITVSFPVGMEFPLESQQIVVVILGNIFTVVLSCSFNCRPPPPTILCSVKGCNNPKKYSDSITQRPLCSLQCYKRLRNCPQPHISTSAL
ncbi:INO80 complex subunit B-like isoform X2 [Dysidea avara]|uniref:INO80 complex subunit B-like isoform X2 n=1 Tax=Dysidea avara TaxID=196820 RepID=UPI00332C467E